MATFKALQDEALDVIDESTSAQRSRVNTYLNRAQNIIAYDRQWKFRYITGATLSLTNGTQIYSLATTAEKPDSVRDVTNDIYLTEVSYKDVLRGKPDPDQNTGTPAHWYVYDYSSGVLRIGFDPVPNGAISIEYDYWRTVADMSADGDTSLIPDYWEWLMVEYAIAMMLLREEDSRYAIYNKNFENGLARMRTSETVISVAPQKMRWVQARKISKNSLPTRDGPNV